MQVNTNDKARTSRYRTEQANSEQLTPHEALLPLSACFSCSCVVVSIGAHMEQVASNAWLSEHSIYTSLSWAEKHELPCTLANSSLATLDTFPLLPLVYYRILSPAIFPPELKQAWLWTKQVRQHLDSNSPHCAKLSGARSCSGCEHLRVQVFHATQQVHLFCDTDGSEDKDSRCGKECKAFVVDIQDTNSQSRDERSATQCMRMHGSSHLIRS